MSQDDASQLRRLVANGATLMDIIEHLRNREPTRDLTPMGFLYPLHVEVGISFVITRDMFDFFNPQMAPIAPIDQIEERWRGIVERWKSGNRH